VRRGVSRDSLAVRRGLGVSMTFPPLPKPRLDYGRIAISAAIEESKPLRCPTVLGIFERKTTRKRRESAYKASASRMGKAFAEKLFRKEA
jgi:hypothetical protein